MEENFQDIHIESIEAIGFVKKGLDNVFIVSVSWSNDWEIEVSRRYSDFVSFHRALLQYSHGSQSYPQLPAIKDIFGDFFSNEDALLQPNMQLLNVYCSEMSGIDGQLVQSFFESAQYDARLRRRNLVHGATECNDQMLVTLPKYLVLSDYVHRSFSLRAGDIVTKLGQDKQDWSLVGLKNCERMQFGWIKTVCLLEVEGADDPLVNDLIMFFNDAQSEDDRVFCQDAIRPSSTPFSSSTISSGRESADLTKDGVVYYQYTLTEDCYLSCPFSEDILLNNGMKIVVIDKDTDGWWYTCTLNGDEGWLPSTFLEPRRASLRKGKREMDAVYYPSDIFRRVPCQISKTFGASQRDELSVKAGERVELLHESPSGWWTVRSDHTVGLVPGLFITKPTESSLQQSVRKLYSIGFNSSLLSEPPPRRETFSPCLSPISPPPVFEGTLFETGFSQGEMDEKNHHVLGGAEEEAISEVISPQLMVTLEGELGSTSNENWPDQRDHLRVSPSIKSPGDENPLCSIDTTSQPVSETKRPATLGFIHGHPSSPSFTQSSKSPIPDRFMKSLLGSSGRQNETGSISPNLTRESRSPIPDRFMISRSPTPDIGGTGSSSSQIKKINTISTAHSPHLPTDTRATVPVRTSSESSASSLQTNDQKRNVSKLALSERRPMRRSAPLDEHSTDDDEDELFPESNDNATKLKQSLSSQSLQQRSGKYNSKSSNPCLEDKKTDEHDFLFDSSSSTDHPQRSSSAPPTVGHISKKNNPTAIKKQPKKIDLRISHNTSRKKIIPETETSL